MTRIRLHTLTRLYRQRGGSPAHAVLDANFKFTDPDAEERFEAGEWRVSTYCGKTFRYGKQSVMFGSETSVHNACEDCFE